MSLHCKWWWTFVEHTQKNKDCWAINRKHVFNVWNKIMTKYDLPNQELMLLTTCWITIGDKLYYRKTMQSLFKCYSCIKLFSNRRKIKWNVISRWLSFNVNKSDLFLDFISHKDYPKKNLCLHKNSAILLNLKNVLMLLCNYPFE